MQRHSPTANEKQARMSPFAYASVLLIGVYLGILFVKSEVASWERIHEMFLFKEAHMYVIISLAIAVAMLSMFLIKRLGIKSVDGKPINYEPKPYNTGVIIGGMLFGPDGQSQARAPAQFTHRLAPATWMALFTFTGAMLGMFAYAALKPRLPH